MIKEILGGNYSALVVTDTNKYEQENLKWDIGTFAWFGIIILTACIAGTATYRNQKLVKAKKDEKDKTKELGGGQSIHEKRKEETPEQKEEKTHPSFWVQWDLIVNLRSLIYPMRINSSV